MIEATKTLTAAARVIESAGLKLDPPFIIQLPYAFLTYGANHASDATSVYGRVTSTDGTSKAKVITLTASARFTGRAGSKVAYAPSTIPSSAA